MTPPEQPQAPDPAPKPQQPSRIERFINSLDWGKKLLVATGGLIFGIGAILAAIQGLKIVNGHRSPPPTPTTVSSLPPTPTVVSPPTPTPTAVRGPATSPPAANRAPSPAVSAVPVPVPVPSSSSKTPRVNLIGTLLPASALGPNATQILSGTNVSTIRELCGPPVKNAMAGAYEVLSDPDQMFVYEIIMQYRDAAAAIQEIDDERAAVNTSSTGCLSQRGPLMKVQTNQDLKATVPDACATGEYLKTQESVLNSSGGVALTGAHFVVQCDTLDVTIEFVESGSDYRQGDARATALMNEVIAALNP